MADTVFISKLPLRQEKCKFNALGRTVGKTQNRFVA